MYEAEYGFNLGSAQFYLNDAQKWAVSKVGMYDDKRGALDIEGNDRVEVANNSVNPKFFKSARMSPGSLRYYGFGLENGPYTVTLHFAEIGFPNRSSNTWESLAKRVFDIYIQVAMIQLGKETTTISIPMEGRKNLQFKSQVIKFLFIFLSREFEWKRTLTYLRGRVELR